MSGGGPYAAVCGYKIPERLTKVGIVVGLAPTNIKGVLQGMAFMNKMAWSSYHKFPFLMNVTSLSFLIQTKKYIPAWFTFAYRAKADRNLMTKKVKERISRNVREAFIQGKNATGEDLRIYTENWGFEVKDISAKVFLWYGDVDKNVSLEMGHYYASQIKASKLIVYPNEGHFVQVTHAEEIVKELIS